MNIKQLKKETVVTA